MSIIWNMGVNEIGLGLSFVSLGIWIYLLCFRGQFWRSNRFLTETTTNLENWPSVCAVIPARNEAELLPVTLRSLLEQSYPGNFTIILVDDHSTDGTANIARQVAAQLDKSQKLHVVAAEPLPSGWTGKLWAMSQGIQFAQTLTSLPDYFLLTDADIEHDQHNLQQLVTKAQQEKLALVSLMVRLRCETFWEKLLIPAFIFFFEKLYPFDWVNNPNAKTAAAAGGCILISNKSLTEIGGLQAVKNALIDDCALAQAVKVKQESIWLGLSNTTRSLRPYPTLATIWEMVARTAFTQLNYSPLLLVGTLLGMTLTYLVPPVGVILGAFTGNWLIAIASLTPYLLMACAYFPTIRVYRCSPVYAFCLPAIALLYTLMTLDSALRHYSKRGGSWKGRVYSETLGQ